MLPEDLDAVHQIESEVYSKPWPRLAFESCLNDESYVLWVDRGAGSGERSAKGRELAGFICCSVVLDECSIMNIAIANRYQGRGFGRFLIQNMIDRMSGMGVSHIFLDVRVSNASARALYQKTGFVEIGLRKNYYSNPDEDAIVMAKSLEPGAKS